MTQSLVNTFNTVFVIEFSQSYVFTPNYLAENQLNAKVALLLILLKDFDFTSVFVSKQLTHDDFNKL